MGWNYRVIRHAGQIPWMAIHETFYDEDDQPYAFGEQAASIGWDEPEGTESATEQLIKMRAALSLPVLDADDFAPANNAQS